MAKGARFLDSTHLLFEESGGFSAIMKMFRHDPSTTLSSRTFGGVQDWTTRAPMLALSNPDPALAFPAGTTLQPKVFIRNASGKVFTAHLRFNWRSATTSGKSTPLDLTFKPNETQVVDVASLQAQKLLPANAQWAAVILSAPVLPEELLAVAASYDQTGRYGTQTPFSDQLATHWEAGAWEVDSTHNTLSTISNGSNQLARAQLTILYNQGTGQYQIERTLAPDEQMALDFGKLIHNRVPDKNGNTLPPDLTWGTYRLLDLNDNPTGSLYEGKVIVDKTYGHASYNCVICCGPNNPWMVYNPVILTVNGSLNQGVQAMNTCSQRLATVTVDFPTWWTDNTSIATASNKQINGVAPGTTNHNAQSINMYWGPKEDSGGGDCPLIQEEPFAGTEVNPTVTFSGTPVVPLGGTAPITATVTPTSNVSTISLTLTTTSGGGSAVFSNGKTSMNITSTTVLLLTGVQASSVPNNIVLAASNGSGVLASTNLTVAATGGAIPTNFRQVDAYDAGNGDLHFDYRWDSSSGNLADLQYCVVAEYVTYPDGRNPWPLPSPPFPPDTFPNPTNIGVFATLGKAGDDHQLVPFTTFIKPYSNSTFTAKQNYQFACTYYDSGNFHTMMGPNFIVRTVSQYPNGTWEFTVTKSGAIATINPLP
jgi:hypothetical protein